MEGQTTTQMMTPLEYVFIEVLKGKLIEIERIENGQTVSSFETIKTIQKLPQIQDVVIETQEGSKKTISIDKIYNWGIDVQKPRVVPNGHERPRRKFEFN